MEVRHRSCARWLKSECKLLGINSRLGAVKILFDTAAFFIFVMLHPWGQLRTREALLCHRSNSLLTLVLVFLHHHLKSGHEDSPRNDPCTELVQHLSIDILIPNCRFPRFLDVPLVERKWLLSSLGLGNTGFLVFNLPLLLFFQDLLI